MPKLTITINLPGATSEYLKEAKTTLLNLFAEGVQVNVDTEAGNSRLSERDRRILTFLYHRLRNVHNENQHYDYMQGLAGIIIAGGGFVVGEG